MAKIKTITYKEQDVSLLFGARWYRNSKTSLDFKGIEAILDRVSELDVEFVAALILEAHENACFYKKSDLVIKDIDEALYLLDELDLMQAVELITQGIMEMSGVDRLPEKEKAKLMKEGEALLKKKATDSLNS
jgi:hypothetical protein